MKRYRDKVRDEVLSGEREWSSLERKPKSREKWVSQYGSEERREWVSRQPCIICGDCNDAPSENAHTEAGGMGMKGPPESIVPMCREHHEDLHRIGRDTFEERYGISLEHYAAYYAGLWENHEEDG